METEIPNVLDSAASPAELSSLETFESRSSERAPEFQEGMTDIPDRDRPKYDPYAYTPPEKDRVTPGPPPQKPGNRIVKIETASDLMAEIRWCLSDGGHFTLHRSFVAPPKVGYFLEHRAYNDGEGQVKTALARKLIEQKAIRSDDPTKGPGSGHREFYIWDDRAFPKSTTEFWSTPQ